MLPAGSCGRAHCADCLGPGGGVRGFWALGSRDEAVTQVLRREGGGAEGVAVTKMELGSGGDEGQKGPGDIQNKVRMCGK